MNSIHLIFTAGNKIQMGLLFQMSNATIRKVAPQESDADEEETQNTTHSGSDGGGAPTLGADAKILKKPGLGKLTFKISRMKHELGAYTNFLPSK